MMGLRTGFPEAGMRWMRVLAIGAGAVLLAAATLNATDDGAVISLSVVPTSGRAQVVIGVDGDVSAKDFVLRGPDRIVVDITGATLGVRRNEYDRVARGGLLDVKYAQNKPNVVRVVLYVDGPRHYDVVRGKGAILVSVDGGGQFAVWRAGQSAASPTAAASYVALPPPTPRQAPAPRQVTTLTQAVPTPVMVSTWVAPSLPMLPEPQGQGAPRISITFDKAPISDVLAQFAAYARRTIIPAKGVTGDVTAEIKDQPWDVAMKVILNANGYDAVEDPNGIIIVNTLEALAARPRTEALTTITLRFNYTAAAAVAEAVRGRLTRDCGTQSAGPVGVAPVGGQASASASPMNCPVRGAVSADSLTNSVSITDAPTALPDIVQYAKTLDVRQPQVNIKAKIILVDRTQLEGLGLKYDIGSRNQHFNQLVARTDSTGALETGNVIFLGGNTLSAIANAAQSVPGAALSIVYSAALGAFDFTTFLEALQDVSLLDVQAEPSVTTLNYRTAVLSAGTQVPIRTSEPGAGANSAGQVAQVTVNFRQTGIVLTVTPFITNNRQIKMKVAAENSDVQFISGEGAIFPTQKIENELLVSDGETAVMGGLTQTSVRVTKSGIPLLVDLPLIGRLFGITNRQETKRDLLILITPHIVDEGDMTMEPRRQP
jgi:type IV pilus assembly protein PilQ